MNFEPSQWGTYQWTLYSVGLGVLGGIAGNLFATYYIRALDQKEKYLNINWEKRYNIAKLAIIGLLIVIIFIILFVPNF